eukprot:SAG11_NODE_15756_length_567_cov_1.025641_1_plen_65_part_00
MLSNTVCSGGVGGREARPLFVPTHVPKLSRMRNFQVRAHFALDRCAHVRVRVFESFDPLAVNLK